MPRAFANNQQQFDTLPGYATLILGGEKAARFPPHSASGGVLRYKLKLGGHKN